MYLCILWYISNMRQKKTFTHPKRPTYTQKRPTYTSKDPYLRKNLHTLEKTHDLHKRPMTYTHLQIPVHRHIQEEWRDVRVGLVRECFSVCRSLCVCVCTQKSPINTQNRQKQDWTWFTTLQKIVDAMKSQTRVLVASVRSADEVFFS